MYIFSTENWNVCGLVATQYMILASRSPSIGVQEAEIGPKLSISLATVKVDVVARRRTHCLVM
jgi:hypothetical protein